MGLLENKKPRFKNRGLSCGPIRANGSNQVDLSLMPEQSAIIFLKQSMIYFWTYRAAKLLFPNGKKSMTNLNTLFEKANK